VFKRGGETNLVRKTVTKNGVVKQRMHYFYHDSVYVGFYYTGPIGSGFESQQNTPYRIGLDFDKLGKVQYVGIIETNGNQTEEFVYTNGLFLPDDGLLKE
jgi:hypothetical protein